KRQGVIMLFNPKLQVLHYSSPTKRNEGTRSAYWLARDYVTFLGRMKPEDFSTRVRLMTTVLAFAAYWGYSALSSRALSPFVSAIRGLNDGYREMRTFKESPL